MNSFHDNTAKGNILIVDDLPNNLRLLSAMLTGQGYEVRSALSGTAALMTIQVGLPDLILLDINMPHLNGYEVCERLKSNPQTRDIPIIFLSALGEAIDKVKAFRVGGADYITKPFQIEEVLVRIEHQLSLQRIKINLQQAKTNALRALEREQELNQLKSEFISMVSHNFRTPLTSIRGFAELLRHNSQTLSAETKDCYFDKIDAAIEHVLHLLDEVLLIGSIESTRAQCQTTLLNLESLCSDLVETLQLSTEYQHQIDFEWTGDCTEAEVDQALIYQILSNLLSNAIKYSSPQGNIHLRLNCQNKTIVLQVQDLGIGIPLDSQPYVFDPFYRCSNVGAVKGTGLGLAVVKRCVDLHKGQIELESQEGVGTTFTVILPVACC